MKKIITAINNPNLNEKLNEEDLIEIVCKDFQYKEAILEYLEKNNNIDLMIINEEIPGELSLIDLIIGIKNNNSNIDIIVILIKQNIDLENKLNGMGITKICYNNKMSLTELVEKIIEEEIDVQEELKKEVLELRKMILDKEVQSKNTKVKSLQEVVHKFYYNKVIKPSEEKFMKHGKTVITITGDRKAGKTELAINLFRYLQKLNQKVCIVDLSFYMNMNLYFEMKNESVENENYGIILNQKDQIVDSKFLNIKLYLQKYDFIIIDYQFEKVEEFLNLNKISNKIFYISNSSIQEIEKVKKIYSKINNNKFIVIINKFNSKYSISYEILKTYFSNSIYNKNQKKIHIKLLNKILEESKVENVCNTKKLKQ